MKKGIVSFLLLCLALSNQAQIDVAWGGQQIANPKNSYIESIIGGNDAYVYALKVKSHGSRKQAHFAVDSYARTSLGFVGSKEFYLPPQSEATGLLERIFLGAGKYRIPGIEKIFLIQNKFLVFSSFYSRDKEKYYAYMQYMSTEGAPIGTYQLIDSISALGKHNKGSFDFILSEDKSRILVYHSEPFDKNANEKFSYKVLDADLHTLWAKNLEMPYPDKQFHINSYRIDNAGNVYMLAHIDKNKEELSRRKPTYIYSILAYFYQEDKIKEYKMDLGNEFISDAAFNINPAGDLVCTGFYSKSSESNQAGVFYMKIDRKTKEVVERSIREFDKDFLLEFMSERKIDKGRELYNFDIGHLLLRDDGSALMVAEQYYMDVVSYYNPASHSYNYTYHYYYNDIIVVGFDQKGQISLLKKISKYQHSVNDGGPFASYVLVDGGDMLHFIYNDNPENVHRPESEIEHGHVSSMNNPGRSVVVMVSMDMKGQTQRTQLLDNHSHKNASWFRPKVNMKISDKDVILFSSRGKYYRFGRVTL
jgi:hypothetical protein